MVINKIIIIPVCALVIGVGGGLIYQMSKQHRPSQPSAMSAQEQTAALLAAVGKLMVLPDEQPVVATVQDPSKLQNQPLFRNAQVGDKVLIFQNARKAVLYDPVKNRIVDIAPLAISPTPVP